ncbi:MAG: endolytic transglycosylase MltG [Lachnospiraceae bacterium]|nr:endolytic transglycosylase MltG [Lachnospiraceae bacterium]
MLKAVRTMLIIILNIIFYGVVLFGGVQLCKAGYSFAYEVLGDTAADYPPGQNRQFTITKGQGGFAVAENLEEQQLVKNKYSFYLRMKLQESSGTSLREGTYTLNTSMSYEEILGQIVK